MTPKIDYVLLGQALEEYKKRGYRYVEVPWMVSLHAIRATLPEQFEPIQVAMKQKHSGADADDLLPYRYDNYLVGSAEQGFLDIELGPGAYVGVTPCFRHEPDLNLFYQTGFMKIELFCNMPHATVDRLLADAREVMSLFVDPDTTIDVTETCEGFDLEIAEVEVGSYGERSVPHFGRWVYGTGLALPRFSVARALSGVA